MASEIAEFASSDDDSVGLVETSRIALFDDENPLALRGGGRFGPIDVAYQTYGTLSPQKDNAIFICHALTGDMHAAGQMSGRRKPGWWDGFIGPGKALDTDRYFVICANVLGGCQGTTGPSCKNPQTGAPYGLDFPFITVEDIVAVHSELVRRLGIEQLLAVIGGSLGGMQVLSWAAQFPEQLSAAVVLASAARLSAQGIAFNAVGARAIYADPKFLDGKYYDQDGPRFGLALARMVAHITYLSEASIELKFGRRLQHQDSLSHEIEKDIEFQIESYLHYQGKRFVERFDANSYLYLTRAMDYFDLTEQSEGGLEGAFATTDARFLVVSYDTDWLFPTAQSKEIVQALLRLQKHVTFAELPSPYGHDSFLIELDQLTRLVTPFLAEALESSRKKS